MIKQFLFCSFAWATFCSAMEDDKKKEARSQYDELSELTPHPYKDSGWTTCFMPALCFLGDGIAGAYQLRTSTHYFDLDSALGQLENNPVIVKGTKVCCQYVALCTRDMLKRATRILCKDPLVFCFLMSHTPLTSDFIFAAATNSPHINLKKIAEKLKTEYADSNPLPTISMSADRGGYFMYGDCPRNAHHDSQFKKKLVEWLSEK